MVALKAKFNYLTFFNDNCIETMELIFIEISKNKQSSNIFYLKVMAKGKKSLLHDWEDLGNDIVRDRNTGREAEKSIVVLDPIYDPKNEDFIYNYRKETKKPLVATYGSELLVQEKPAKGDKKKKDDPYSHMLVLNERIPHRLSDAPQLEYSESLYVLDRSLEGFEEAYKKCGPMRVNDRMIGFDPEGRCKVWVNENLSFNHPSHPRRNLQSTLADSNQYIEGKYKEWRVGHDETDMVQDVVDVVEGHCMEGRFPSNFSSRIRSEGLGFSEARRLIHEEGLNMRETPIPDRVDLFGHRVRSYRRADHYIDRRDQYVDRRDQYVDRRDQYVDRREVVETKTYTQQPAQGYRFNYLPAEKPYQPDIFASRVGEHGVHRGHHY